MSLVNDMLRDLQARAVRQAPAAAGLAAVTTRPRRATAAASARAAALTVCALALLAALVAAVWIVYGNPPGLAAAEAAPAVAAEPASAGEAGTAARPASLRLDHRISLSLLSRAGSELVDPVVPAKAESPRPVEAGRPASTGPRSTAGRPPPAAAAATAGSGRGETPPMAATARTGAARSPVKMKTRVAQARASTAAAAGADGADPVAWAVDEAAAAMRVGRWDRAEAALRQALGHDPDHFMARRYLFVVLRRQLRLDEAEQLLLDGLTRPAVRADVAKLYARMLVDRGDLEAAVGALLEHRRSGAADLQYEAFLAALLQRQGRHGDSAAIYRRLLAADPSRASWWVGLGISADALGDRDTARAAYGRAAGGELDPALADYAATRLAALAR